MISQIDDFAIPNNLMHIPNPPQKMYIRGTFPKVKHLLCVVGTRNPTHYGIEACRKLIEGLHGQSIAVVSGLALGIDAVAHEAALDFSIPTIAIPGSGLLDSSLYPAKHMHLAKRILEHGGCLVSEFEPYTIGAPWTFPQRNRIMAGISDAILVIEAKEKSGTLITAKLAVDFNKTVLAVPGPITSEHSEGSHLLIRLGAVLVRNSDDILDVMGIKKKNSPLKNNRDKVLENLKSTCSQEELELINQLTEPKEKDELVYELNIPIHKLNATLSLLELKGITKQQMGKIQLALFD